MPAYGAARSRSDPAEAPPTARGLAAHEPDRATSLLHAREDSRAIREGWCVTEPSVRRWSVFGFLLGTLPIGAVLALAIHHDELAIWLAGACAAGLLLLAARWGIGTSRSRRRSPDPN
jgi:hypothetical protein